MRRFLLATSLRAARLHMLLHTLLHQHISLANANRFAIAGRIRDRLAFFVAHRIDFHRAVFLVTGLEVIQLIISTAAVRQFIPDLEIRVANLNVGNGNINTTEGDAWLKLMNKYKVGPWLPLHCHAGRLQCFPEFR